MTISKIYKSLIMLCLGTLIFGCQDNFEYREAGEIAEGNSRVNLSISYDDFSPALETRSDGESIESINTLWLVAYKYNSTAEAESAGELVLKKKVYDDGGSDPDSNLTQSPSEGENRIEFTETLANGYYRLYAVANCDITNADVSKVDSLRKIETSWVTYKDKDDNNRLNHVRKNQEMFGWFVNGTSDTNPNRGKATETADIVEISRTDTRLHAFLYRCASKVTLAFDGSGLNEGVSIYLMGATIKDIPKHCALGNPNVPGKDPNAPEGSNNLLPVEDEIIHEGETIVYYNASAVQSAPTRADSYFDQFNDTKLDKDNPFYPYREATDRADLNRLAHTSKAEALFFYENMQGEGKDKRQKDENKDGIVDDNDIEKDDKPYGTYIEVEAIYRVVNTEKTDGVVTNESVESGIIRYRFMLGKNITTDYNAERNYHYKLTLRFNGTAKDIDWHIDYQPQRLEVSDPLVMDYRGMVFDPSNEFPNLGHEFVNGTTIRVSSYTEGENELEPYTITYDGSDKIPDWLNLEIVPGRYPYEENLVFTAGPSNPETINLNQFNPARGTESNPVNLADPARPTVAPANAKAIDTANCYVIDEPGWFLLPAVYGNAIKGGSNNPQAYTPGGKGLSTFKNHLGNEIQTPWIKDDLKLITGAKLPSHAAMIWQDVQGLVDYDQMTYTNPFVDGYGVEYNDIVKVRYIDSAYGGKGGILFFIKEAKEGNALIGLLDKTAQTNWFEGQNDGYTAPGAILFYNQEVIWSWHIWVTNIMTTNILKNDRTLTVTSANSGDFEVLPFNLGWCSNAGDEPVKYYPGRECKITITSGEKTITKLISQKSHISIPCGNNPYYQWGRKDPFVATTNQKNIEDNTNKGMWVSTQSVTWGNPRGLSMVYAENKKGSHYWDNTYWEYGEQDPKDSNKNDGRLTTEEAIDNGALITYPYLWHNPKAVTPGLGANPWASVNVVYENLWGDKGDGLTDNSVKTIYDPCPVGYRVPNQDVFTAFTVGGAERTNAPNWYYDAIDKNIVDKYDNVYEFYTNTNKNQSIIFPKSGYRDWDNLALSIWYGSIGYAWTGKFDSYKLHVDYTGEITPLPQVDWIVNFEFSHNDYREENYIRPQNKFYGCDGFPIRPVKDE